MLVVEVRAFVCRSPEVYSGAPDMGSQMPKLEDLFLLQAAENVKTSSYRQRIICLVII